MPESPGERASKLHGEIARAIVKWVVQSDLQAGYHLKEQQLSDIFRLSRSPIRGALKLLDHHGVVEQKPARGFFLLMSGSDLSNRETVLPQPAIDELYRKLANAWFAGEIPDQVSTARIVRHYDGNAREVGHALKRLAADGVIERSAGKGWRLGPNLATPEDFRDSYQFRLTIEPVAILLDTFKLNAPLAALVRRRHERILAADSNVTIKEMVDADLEFHHLIAASCGNQFFAQAIDRQNVLRRLTEILTTPEGERLRASSREHVAILDALEAARLELAATLMREHLTISKTYSPDFIVADKARQT